MKKGSTVKDLYDERLPLYQKYADFTLDCTGLTAEECVERIVKAVSSQNNLQS